MIPTIDFMKKHYHIHSNNINSNMIVYNIITNMIPMAVFCISTIILFAMHICLPYTIVSIDIKFIVNINVVSTILVENV